jgi:hypothetical protein
MDGRRGNVEESLHICFGRREPIELGIGVDEGEILELEVGIDIAEKK